MNMLKFYYVFVLDSLPDIPEFHFCLGSGRPQTRFNSNVVFIFQKSLNVWQAICLEAKHVGVHLMDQLKKKCVSRCLLSQILFQLFCLLMYMYFLFILLTHSVHIIIFSVDGHHLAFFV